MGLEALMGSSKELMMSYSKLGGGLRVFFSPKYIHLCAQIILNKMKINLIFTIYQYECDQVIYSIS